MAKPTASRRWLAALGWGSLALNVVLIALIVFHPRLPFMPPPPPPPPEVVMEEMAGRLDAADRAVFEEVMARRKAEIQARFVAMGRHIDTFKEEFTREPFDGLRFQASKAKLDAARAEFEQVIMAAMVEAMSRMSPAGRERLSRMPPGPP